MDHDALLPWVALALVPKFHPRDARRALDAFPDAARVAFALDAAALIDLGVSPGGASGLVAARGGLAARARDEIRAARKSGVRVVPRSDPEYPPALESLEDPPPVLWTRGTISRDAVRIALVGARRASAYGRRVARGLAAGLVARGVEIVSGGARGIDACAHEGALEAEGRTIAVLGSGLHEPYPAEHVDLFHRIAGRGAVITEFPLETGPRPEHFPRRNRLIAALSEGTVVVEAARRSGSLLTAGHALDLGREVLAVPGPVTSESSEGCHRLIQDGAKLVARVEDVLEELPERARAALLPTAGESVPPPADRTGWTADETALFALLSDDPEPLHVDAIAERAPFGFARLQTALFALVLRGAVEQMEGGYYLPRPSAGSKN